MYMSPTFLHFCVDMNRSFVADISVHQQRVLFHVALTLLWIFLSVKLLKVVAFIVFYTPTQWKSFYILVIVGFLTGSAWSFASSIKAPSEYLCSSIVWIQSVFSASLPATNVLNEVATRRKIDAINSKCYESTLLKCMHAYRQTDRQMYIYNITYL